MAQPALVCAMTLGPCPAHVIAALCVIGAAPGHVIPQQRADGGLGWPCPTFPVEPGAKQRGKPLWF